ncbi:YidC/Oxa1 family membrane protein insertase [Peptoniphilus sp. GNH]|nr:putative ATP synthase F0, A subunit [Clostridiales bacterium KA00134]UHR02345.1 YidC/Oxa1 family membrane protein insertase [Peptoniphilus sp. GNH]
MELLRNVLGMFVRAIYDGLQGAFAEPSSVSFFAISIVLATLILKLVMLPLSFSQIKNQKKMAILQPEIEKLKQKYKHDPQTLAQKQQQLYKDSNYSMLGGCLPMIFTLVVLIAFYRVFMYPAQYIFKEAGMYDSIQKNFFYISNIDNPDPSVILPFLAGLSTFLSSYLAQKANESQGMDQGKSMMNTMMLVMPVMIFMMGRRFAAALVIYWIVSNLFQVLQQQITNMVIKKTEEDKDVPDKDS